MTVIEICVFLFIFTSLFTLSLFSTIESYTSGDYKLSCLYGFLSGLSFSYGFRVLDALYKIM